MLQGFCAHEHRLPPMRCRSILRRHPIAPQYASGAIRRMTALRFTIAHYCLIISGAIDASTHHIMAINDGQCALASMTKPANFARRNAPAATGSIPVRRLHA